MLRYERGRVDDDVLAARSLEPRDEPVVIDAIVTPRHQAQAGAKLRVMSAKHRPLRGIGPAGEVPRSLEQIASVRWVELRSGPECRRRQHVRRLGEILLLRLEWIHTQHPVVARPDAVAP